MKAEQQAVIVDAVRTPIGKKQGVFSETRADELGVAVLRALVERSGIDPAELDDVVTGCVTQTGEQGMNIGRLIVLAAGLPVTVPGTTVNRMCGSSLQSLSIAAMAVASGASDAVCALGVENMTRVPMGSDGGGFHDAIPERFGLVPQGVSAELMAEKWELSREVLDTLSLRSHERALATMDAGLFDREVVPVTVTREGKKITVERDETPRRGGSMQKLAALKPSFVEGGTITAGNSSQISDGAAGLLVTTPQWAKKRGLTPRARIVSFAAAGVDPTVMLTGPAPATRKALALAGLTLDDMDVIECNEAFAPVPLVFAHEMGIDAERLNPRGGAIALGHPLGATGARLATTLLHTMEDEDKRYGLATLCIGFGQGMATIIERLG